MKYIIIMKYMHEVIKDVCITIPENNDTLVLDEKMRIGSKIGDVILSDISADQFGEIDDVTKYAIYSCLNEVIANSLDVNSTRLRFRMKFDNNTGELIITLGDNGDGINAIKTSEKSENHIGGAGIGFENIKLGGSNIKLFRNSKGAVVVIKMNLKYLSTFASKTYLLEEFRNGNISPEDLKAHIEYMLKKMMDSILSDIDSGKLKKEQGHKLLDQYCNF